MENQASNIRENIMEITDFNDPRLDVYARLTENQLVNRHEPEKGMFIAESPIVIERALDAGYVPISFLVEKRHIEGEAKYILDRCPKVPVFTAEFDVLANLTGFQLTRGMLACMYRIKLPTLEEVCKNAKRIVVMENVMNPTNVGAIFRSAAALHMDAVILTRGSSNPLYRRSIRVSMGNVFLIPWTVLEEEVIEENEFGGDVSGDMAKEAPGEKSWVKQLQRLGFKTVAMALSDNSISIDDPILKQEEKLAIVLGTEGDGLLDSTIGACDYTVKIPMSHGVDSLNVAAASAVAFWELGRRD